MSLYSCDIHGRRVPGTLEGANCSLLRGRVRYFRKLRLCPEHLDQILRHESYGFTADDGDNAVLEQNMCSACGQEPLEAALLDLAIFRTWRHGTGRTDYLARLCQQHSTELELSLGLSLEDTTKTF